MLKLTITQLSSQTSIDPVQIPFEPHAKNIAAFINAVESGKTFEINGSEARKAVEIVLAIYTSAREQRPFIF
jgi:predicted dehydrogenase